MDSQQVREFQQAIGTASWTMDLYRFAEAIGQDPQHDHTQQKFRELQEASRAVNRFDAETLAKVINAAE